jgi:membrane fusion protein, multidrug efflux system
MNVSPPPARRKRVVSIILLIALLTGVAVSAWYFWEERWYQSTSNAYLTGNLVEVSAQIGGIVVWIGAEQNEAVAAEEELLRLADGDQVQTLALREQELALAVQDVLVLHAQIDRLDAQQRLRAITHKLAREEFERRRRLHTQNMVSQEELDAARTRQEETLGELETAGLALREAKVRAGSRDLEQHPRVMAAAANLRSSYRDWRKTRVLAPVEGEIARRRVQAGQWVHAGTPLFSITERQSAWVEANFKETQLRHMRPGQPVEIHSDLYGDDVTLNGHVDSIGTGTGAIFSLLPPQNATGNWIKIVQRVPVRIALDEGYDAEHPLPFGASLQVRVDTHDRSGPALASHQDTGPVASADIYGYQDEGATELIARIIATASSQADQRQQP